MRFPMSPSPAGPVRAAAAAAAMLLLAAACGGSAVTLAPTGAPTPAATPAPTAPPTAVPTATPVPPAARLFEVSSSGGFINPAASIGAMPTLVVDTDGKIYTAGVAADGSSPLVPLVTVRDTGAAGAAAILAAIKTAGLDKEGAGGGVVADTGATVFTFTINGVEVVNQVAGGMGPGGPGKPGGGVGGPGASGAPGAAAMDLLSRLQDPAVSWGAPTAAPATTYAPTAYRVFLAPFDASLASLPFTPIPWPLATAPDAFGSPAAADHGVTGLRSGVVMGADAAVFAKAVAGAQQGTSFSVGKTIWQTWIRPLLPDELGN